MKQFPNIQSRRIDMNKSSSLVVFLTEEGYQPGDPVAEEGKTSVPLCWVVFHDRINRLIGSTSNIALVCDLEVLKFKNEMNARTIRMAEDVPQDAIQAMMGKVEAWIRETIMSKYD